MANHNHIEPNLFQLQVLGTLLREQSLTRAAQVLNTNQPALSRVLSKLREHFGDPLFVRVAFEMKPTPKALALSGSIRTILDELAALQCETVFSPETSSRAFKVFSSDAAVIVLLPVLLKNMRARAPNVRLSALQSDTDHLCEWLQSGQVDLAAGSYPSLVHGIKRQRLFTTQYVSIVKKGRLQDGRLGIGEFSESDHVVVTALGSSHEMKIVEEALESFVSSERIVARVPGFAAAALLAKHTDSIVTLPEPIADVLAKELDMETFPTPLDLPEISVYQYWHERFDKEPGHQWIREFFYQHCREKVGG